MDTLICSTGRPQHGRLPVAIYCGTYELKFIASGVPVDPIRLLIEALSKVVKGVEGEVWWNLETAGYFFVFSRSGTGYSLHIIFADDQQSRKTGTEKFAVTGNLEQIVRPFWRALRRHEWYSDSEWPRFPKSRFRRLTKNLDQLRGADKGRQPPTSVEELVARYKNGERYFPDIRFDDETDLRGLDLAGVTFEDSSLFGCTFNKANLQGVKFLSCALKHSVFDQADLSDARIIDCAIETATYKEAILAGARFEEAHAYGNTVTGDIAEEWGSWPIDFWGSSGHCGTFYLEARLWEALCAAIKEAGLFDQERMEQGMWFENVAFDGNEVASLVEFLEEMLLVRASPGECLKGIGEKSKKLFGNLSRRYIENASANTRQRADWETPRKQVEQFVAYLKKATPPVTVY